MTNLTKIEQKMLKRLEDECVLHWVVLGPEEVKALNRLVKKGVAIMTVGNAGRKAWSPVLADRYSNIAASGVCIGSK